MSFNTLTTVSLPEVKWSTISTAVLCLAVDERLKGRDEVADHWMDAFMALKEALKTELS